MPSPSCARLISDLNHVSSLRFEFPIRVPERFRARNGPYLLVILVAWWVHASLELLLNDDDEHGLASEIRLSNQNDDSPQVPQFIG